MPITDPQHSISPTIETAHPWSCPKDIFTDLNVSSDTYFLDLVARPQHSILLSSIRIAHVLRNPADTSRNWPFNNMFLLRDFEY